MFGKYSGEQYPKQVLYFAKVTTNGKLETRTKGTPYKCGDLTCTKKYALTDGPGWGGGINVGHSLSPTPQSFYACYGPEVSSLFLVFDISHTMSADGEFALVLFRLVIIKFIHLLCEFMKEYFLSTSVVLNVYKQ